MLYILKIDENITNVLSTVETGTIFKYKDLSINIISDTAMDIKTNNNVVASGRKALKNYYLLYSDEKENFIVIHKTEYETVKDNICNYKTITIDDFSVY